jgi:hypothetical protein
MMVNEFVVERAHHHQAAAGEHEDASMSSKSFLFCHSHVDISDKTVGWTRAHSK